METEVKSQNIIEIADYLFQNPDKKPAEIITEFCGRLRKSYRSVEGYLKKAREYNLSRIQKQEAAKDLILLSDAEDAIKQGIMSRNKALKTLSNIAEGEHRKVGGEIIIPTDSDRIKAIAQLSKMSGWDAPTKITETDVAGNNVVRISPVEAAIFINRLQVTLRHE